jgi:hypothetical protein
VSKTHFGFRGRLRAPDLHNNIFACDAKTLANWQNDTSAAFLKLVESGSAQHGDLDHPIDFPPA